jgi:2,3,4,5-tetrahydropyridine-2-carboxylate N-succinyltransferase
MSSLFSFALGIGTTNSKGDWLEVFYPQPLLKPEDSIRTALHDSLGYDGGNMTITVNPSEAQTLSQSLRACGKSDLAQLASRLSESQRPVVATILEHDTAPTSVPEAYLKLHLLSHRLLKPHGTNLDGLFATLPNVAWTNEGAIDVEELPDRQLQARLNNRVLEVAAVDKFPKLSNYLVPKGVRMAHTARVRLGAYLGEGTTVMHEGFVNFNAGTEGPGMIEGRISAGVMIGAGSDLGGGASTMGTLSGGGKLVNGLGKNCLVGANAGIGIPLGDNCTVEAGLYVTAGTKVMLLDKDKKLIKTVKARELSGHNNLLFIRNSETGAVECRSNSKEFELNEALHANN